MVPTEGAPPTVVISAPSVPQPVPVPANDTDVVVCMTNGAMVAFEPAPASVNVMLAGLASGAPELVQRMPVMDPEPTIAAVIVPAVMPVARLGSNGEGTTTIFGADG